MAGATASVVEKSNLPEYQPGDIVVSLHGWTTYALSNGKGMFNRPLQKLDPEARAADGGDLDDGVARPHRL